MITPKYSFLPLSRSNEEGSRKYLTPDQQKVSSVTTILDKTKSQESVQALAGWRKAVGYQKASEITAKAAGHGTKMHSYLEDYIINDVLKVPGNHPLALQSNKMAKVIVDNGLTHVKEYYGSEVSLYFPGLFAGTADVIGLYKDQEAVLDFKQTNKLKTDARVEDYFLQLAAYVLACNEVYKTNISMGVIMMCSQNLEFQTWELCGSKLEEYKEKWWARVARYYGV